MGNRIVDDQRGAISIYVTIVIMVVFVLTALVFFRAMMSDSQETLERRLSIQANYTAQTAINDVKHEIYKIVQDVYKAKSGDNSDITERIKRDLLGGTGFINNTLRTDCIDSTAPVMENSKLLMSTDFDVYSCVQADLAPSSLEYTNLRQDTSLVLHLHPIAEDTSPRGWRDVNLRELTIEWGQSEIQPSNFATNPTTGYYPAQGAYTQDAPVLQVRLIPISQEIGFNRDDLNTNMRVFFLEPSSGTTSNYDFSSNSGLRMQANCDNTRANGYHCKVSFNVSHSQLLAVNNSYFSSGQLAGTRIRDNECPIKFVISIRPVYYNARVRITGKTQNIAPLDDVDREASPPANSCPHDDSGYNPATPYANRLASDEVLFKNTQIGVIATGKADNVLQRVEERIPLIPHFDYPEFALDSATDICKIIYGDQDSGLSLGAPDGFTGTLPPSCDILNYN